VSRRARQPRGTRRWEERRCFSWVEGDEELRLEMEREMEREMEMEIK